MGKDFVQSNRLLLPSHFGSDTAGVNTTRRYFCEALSFQYRYIPIGVLEVVPGCINDRAPAFRGRDELGKPLDFLSFCKGRTLQRPLTSCLTKHRLYDSAPPNEPNHSPPPPRPPPPL
jgi:hypothetical protein